MDVKLCQREINSSVMHLRLKQRTVVGLFTDSNSHKTESSIIIVTCLVVSTVRRWARTVKESDRSESSVNDQPHSVRSMSASNLEIQVRVDDMIRANRRVEQKNINAEIGISQDRVHHIITKSKIGPGRTSHHPASQRSSPNKL